jgi:hypothetical protein
MYREKNETLRNHLIPGDGREGKGKRPELRACSHPWREELEWDTQP